MTHEEYILAKARIFRYFPAVAAWGKTLTAGQRQAIEQRWQRALIRYDLDAVNDTIDTLATAPDVPWKYAADMERVGLIIASQTGDRIARIREGASSPSDSLPPRPANYTGAGIMGRVLHAIASDTRHVKGCVEFRAEFGRCVKGCPVPRLIGHELAKQETGLTEDTQRFGCHLCRDTGFVSALKSADIVETITTGNVPRVRFGFSVACSCNLGGQRETQGQRDGRKPMERYRPSEDVRLLANDAEIVTTCQALRETWGGRRNAGFDQFNAGEFQ